MGYDMEMDDFHDDEELKKKQQEELEKMMRDILSDVKDMKKDYEKNPSEISGSVVRVHEDSPFMDETFEGEKWKKVIKGGVGDAIDMISNKKDLDKKK